MAAGERTAAVSAPWAILRNKASTRWKASQRKKAPPPGPELPLGPEAPTRPQAVGGPQTAGGPEDPGDCGNHALINALIALRFFRTFHVFPAGNDVLAYLLYFLILHRAGYHFSAHVPVVTLLYADDGGDGRVRRLPRDPESLVVECGGSYDWTRFFEGVVAAIVEEQRWTMAKTSTA